MEAHDIVNISCYLSNALNCNEKAVCKYTIYVAKVGRRDILPRRSVATVAKKYSFVTQIALSLHREYLGPEVGTGVSPVLFNKVNKSGQRLLDFIEVQVSTVVIQLFERTQHI